MNESLIEEELTKEIIGAAIEVHRYWGTGLTRTCFRSPFVNLYAADRVPSGTADGF
jgi:hypothetical protein